MNLLEATGPCFTRSEKKSSDGPLDEAGFMQGDEAPSEEEKGLPFEAHRDSRALVRLIQCPKCSLPFRFPVTLPCGHTVCRPCLPQPQRRPNISFPSTAGRQQGLACPMNACQMEHAAEDCNVDVTFSKVLEIVTTKVSEYRLRHGQMPKVMMQELRRAEPTEDTEKAKEPENPSAVEFQGGLLLATFEMAELGKLQYESDIVCQYVTATKDEYDTLDNTLLSEIRTSAQKEVECQVCYQTMLDPVTTPCGHTFCRNCLIRMLDHAPLCAACRRQLSLPPSLERQPSNSGLVAILNSLCPEVIVARAEALASETFLGALDVPLFVVTVGYPGMGLPLHIFEPRYRLMLRRVMEGNRQFGLVMYNHDHSPQGDLGVTQFKQFGTIMEVAMHRPHHNGSSDIWVKGVRRFKIVAHDNLDGYIITRTERVGDISIAEEERIEAEEISAAREAERQRNDSLQDPSAMEGFQQQQQQGQEQEQEQEQDPIARLSSMTTRELFREVLHFIDDEASRSAPWLRASILTGYGHPPEDPALLPYWISHVLPVAESWKYKILQTTSVRQRLKLVLEWCIWIDQNRGEDSPNNCTVL